MKMTASKIAAKRQAALRKDTNKCLDEQIEGFDPRKLPALDKQAITNYHTTRFGVVVKSRFMELIVIPKGEKSIRIPFSDVTYFKSDEFGVMLQLNIPVPELEEKYLQESAEGKTYQGEYLLPIGTKCCIK